MLKRVIPKFIRPSRRMAVKFYEQDVKAKLAAKRKLAAFLTSLVKQHRPLLVKINLTYIFCDDAYLLEINQQFLNHNTLTDIITFDMSESDDALTGEIYISIDRVNENAHTFGVTYQHELHRVIFHGALHLCGFKDKKPAEKQAMSQQEDSCLEAWFGNGQHN